MWEEIEKLVRESTVEFQLTGNPFYDQPWQCKLTVKEGQSPKEWSLEIHSCYHNTPNDAILDALKEYKTTLEE